MSRSVRKTQLMCHFFKLFSLSIKEAQLPNIDGVFGFWIKSPSCKPGQCYFLLLLGKKNFHYSSFSYSTLLPFNLLVEILFYGCSKWLQSLHQTCACTGALVVWLPTCITNNPRTEKRDFGYHRLPPSPPLPPTTVVISSQDWVAQILKNNFHSFLKEFERLNL